MAPSLQEAQGEGLGNRLSFRVSPKQMQSLNEQPSSQVLMRQLGKKKGSHLFERHGDFAALDPGSPFQESRQNSQLVTNSGHRIHQQTGFCLMQRAALGLTGFLLPQGLSDAGAWEGTGCSCSTAGWEPFCREKVACAGAASWFLEAGHLQMIGTRVKKNTKKFSFFLNAVSTG